MVVAWQVCEDALRAARAFFGASDAVQRSAFATDRARRGFSPQGTENFASLVGQRGPNDTVRKFRIGRLDADVEEEVEKEQEEARGGLSLIHI